MSAVLKQQGLSIYKRALNQQNVKKGSTAKCLLTSTTTWPANRVLLAKMLVLPILQSCAIWQDPIIRLLSPITYQKMVVSKEEELGSELGKYLTITRNLNTVQSPDLEER